MSVHGTAEIVARYRDWAGRRFDLVVPPIGAHGDYRLRAEGRVTGGRLMIPDDLAEAIARGELVRIDEEAS